jgi:uncharacterized C2H2 Zn-finger protein
MAYMELPWPKKSSNKFKCPCCGRGGINSAAEYKKHFTKAHPDNLQSCNSDVQRAYANSGYKD